MDRIAPSTENNSSEDPGNHSIAFGRERVRAGQNPLALFTEESYIYCANNSTSFLRLSLLFRLRFFKDRGWDSSCQFLKHRQTKLGRIERWMQQAVDAIFCLWQQESTLYVPASARGSSGELLKNLSRKETFRGKRNSQMVQPDQGFWVHLPAGRRGCIRTLPLHRRRRVQEPERRRPGSVRG